MNQDVHPGNTHPSEAGCVPLNSPRGNWNDYSEKTACSRAAGEEPLAELSDRLILLFCKEYLP